MIFVSFDSNMTSATSVAGKACPSGAWTTAKGPKIIIYKTPHRTKVNIEQN
jgi:hypothetical protein